jgi:hypothetical protein
MSDLPHTGEFRAPFQRSCNVIPLKQPAEGVISRQIHVGFLEFWIHVSAAISIRHVRNKFAPAQEMPLIVFPDGVVPPLRKSDKPWRSRGLSGGNQRDILCTVGAPLVHYKIAFGE